MQPADTRPHVGAVRYLRGPMAAPHVRHAVHFLAGLLRRLGGRHLPDCVGGQPGDCAHADLAGEAHAEGVLEVYHGRGREGGDGRRAALDGDVE